MKYWQENGQKISIKNEQELAAMRESGKILGEILHQLEKFIKEGVQTDEINQLAEDLMDKYNVIPAFKGYQGFPAAVCANVNEQVVHGIPGTYSLKSGDIISVDCGVIYDNFYSDSAITVSVGKITQEAQALINTAEKALKRAIETAGPGVRVGTISSVIQEIVEKKGFSVIYDLTGHGIGLNLHEDPIVPNFRDSDPGPILQPGMTIAIEPIISAGKPEIKLLRDGWTYVTFDRSLSVQVEHTIAITEKGTEILTKRPA